MQGIFCLILLATCFELSTARPGPIWVMVTARPRPGPHQAGGFSATLLHHKVDHPSPSNPMPSPCFPELRCPEGMNPELRALAPDEEAKPFHARDTKRSTREKSLEAIQAFWRISTQTSEGRQQLARMPIQDPQRIPRNIPKKFNLQRRWTTDFLRRIKRSVASGTVVRYAGFKDVMFRRKDTDTHLPLFLKPNSASNSLMLGIQHVNHTCFRGYFFQELAANTEGGFLVILQAHSGSFLHGNSSGFLSLMNGEAGVATVGHIDNRFFRLKSYVGDTDVRIKHTVTDLHIQATSNGVSLNSADPLAAEGMRFYAYNCTTT